MDREHEHEEPFGFDGRSLEEQLASLDSMNSGAGDPSSPPEWSSANGGGHGEWTPDAPGVGEWAPDAPGAGDEPHKPPRPGEAADTPDPPLPYDQGRASFSPPPQASAGGTAPPEWGPAEPPVRDSSWHDTDPGVRIKHGIDGERPPGGTVPPSWPNAGEQPWPGSAPQPAPYEQHSPFTPEGPPSYPDAPPQEYDERPRYPGTPATPGPAPREPQNADSLRPETLLRGRRRAPSGGWRRVVYRASGGMIHPGESPAELRRRRLAARGRTIVAGGHHRVAVLSLKGGVGKTTTTIALGSTLAALRGDRVVAIDANPDRGTLSDKLHLETAATVRDLLNERDAIRRYADVRGFTSQAASRLEVLASDRDPAVSEAFSEDDYRTVARVLEHFYSICLTDCGTGLLHSAMSGVLRLADQIVLVSSPSVDGARSASATLDWLEAHDFGGLVRAATVVLSGVREGSKSNVDLGRLEEHFASRCKAVVRVPHDPHLEEGAEVELDRLKPATRDAYLQLAATVGDGFGYRSGASAAPPGSAGLPG